MITWEFTEKERQIPLWEGEVIRPHINFGALQRLLSPESFRNGIFRERLIPNFPNTAVTKAYAGPG